MKTPQNQGVEVPDSLATQTLPQRIEALMEACKYHHSSAPTTEACGAIVDLLAVIAMQAEAVRYAEELLDSHGYNAFNKMAMVPIHKALTASADLVALAKKLTTTKGE